MKISIITVVLNQKDHVGDCIESVLAQSYSDIEHIVIDGGSTDGTLEVITSYVDNIARLISEPDKGIYDAMNKGIKLASGDVIGFLNADDVYYDSLVVESIAEVMREQSIDACYSDLVYVNKNDLDKVVRYWRSCEFRNGLLSKGWIPPHPTFYARKSLYEKYGLFDLGYPLAADFELMSRFLEYHCIRSRYIPKIFVKMRMGGVTNRSIANIIKQNMEIIRAYNKNNIHLSGIDFFINKLLLRIGQFSSRQKTYP